MIFLADENFPRPAVEALRGTDFDIRWIAEAKPGTTDEEVVAISVSTRSYPSTFDKDFGELAYPRSGVFSIWHRALPSNAPKPRRDSVGSRIGPKIGIVGGHFSVITRERIRMRRLPRLPG
jgi:Domain of unknown function (DUF5615)